MTTANSGNEGSQNNELQREFMQLVETLARLALPKDAPNIFGFVDEEGAHDLTWSEEIVVNGIRHVLNCTYSVGVKGRFEKRVDEMPLKGENHETGQPVRPTYIDLETKLQDPTKLKRLTDMKQAMELEDAVGLLDVGQDEIRAAIEQARQAYGLE